MVLQDYALCDRKAKACSADLSGSRFIYPVESFVDLIEGILRDPDAGIFHADIAVVEIRIDGHPHFSVVPVVFDGVFNKICDDHSHLDLIDLRVDLAHTDHSQFDISLLRDRPYSSKDQLHHLIDVGILDIELGIFAVHADKCEQLRNDLVLPVDLVLYVDHEFPVHFDRDIFLLDK